jgi:hypothetical protein
MSEVDNNGSGAPKADAQPNFDEKFAATNQEISSIKTQFAEQNQRLEQLLNAVNERFTPKKEREPQQDLGNLLLDNADEAARIIEERAAKRAEDRVNKQLQMSQAAQQVVSDVASKYPEFAQPGSEAANMAIQRASQLPANLRGTPEGAKMVMLEVASELGLITASKRKQAAQNSEDFSIGGNPSPSKRASGKGTEGIDPKTLAFAELLDPSILKDPKRLEALKSAASRDNFIKWKE